MIDHDHNDWSDFSWGFYLREILMCLLPVHVKVGIFWNARSLKLCMMITSIKLYMFILVSVTMNNFQGHRSVTKMWELVVIIFECVDWAVSVSINLLFFFHCFSVCSLCQKSSWHNLHIIFIVLVVYTEYLQIQLVNIKTNSCTVRGQLSGRASDL